MKYDEFINSVQEDTELPSRADAVRATRATFTTLGERLAHGQATNLAGPLPEEVDRYLADAESGQRFSYDDFLDRVAEREDVDRTAAARHAQVVMGVLSRTAYASQLADVRDALPEEFEPLFEAVDWEARPE